MSTHVDSAASTASSGNQFGAFGGVFTPSILTILGVIMFMRTGFVVGSAGVLGAIGVLLAAKSITLLTALSISAISTNTPVRGGGAYFLISRSLGPAAGGAIGLALFLAQAFSVPFYILGLVEALVRVWPAAEPWFLHIGLGVATALFIVNQIGASWAIKAQYAILAVLAASVVSFLVGSVLLFDVDTLRANAAPAYGEGLNFWVVFAIFFPAVTGIMAGVNMSGDLGDPARAIPRGTLAAVFVGGAIYLAQIMLTGGALDRAALVDTPYESLLSTALFGVDAVVIAGVFAATVSSALGSLLGAPRILQALARDDIFPIGYFAKGDRKADEPKRGLWLTFAMTIAVLFIAGDGSGGGALNAVAAVLTMFFLYTYGMTNLAAFVEQASRNPSFRPRFRYFHWVTALLGAIGCFGAAVLINPLAAVIALVVIALVFIAVQRRVLESAFGDAMRGFYYARARRNLVKLAAEPNHPKNWRPTTLVLSGNPNHRTTLVEYAVWLESGRGIVTLGEVVVGELESSLQRAEAERAALAEYVAAKGIVAFPEVVIAPDVDRGLETLVQGHSIGPLKPNLVMLGWPGAAERAEAFGHHLRMIRGLNKSAVIVRDRGLPPKDRLDRRVDIWWRSGPNGSLMTILGYLLTLNWRWRHARLRVLRLIATDRDRGAAHAEVVALIQAARIDADAVVVQGADFGASVRSHSRDADVVLMGFNAPTPDEADEVWATTDAMTDGLPTTLLVMSSGEADVFA